MYIFLQSIWSIWKNEFSYTRFCLHYHLYVRWKLEILWPFGSIWTESYRGICAYNYHIYTNICECTYSKLNYSIWNVYSHILLENLWSIWNKYFSYTVSSAYNSIYMYVYHLNRFLKILMFHMDQSLPGIREDTYFIWNYYTQLFLKNLFSTWNKEVSYTKIFYFIFHINETIWSNMWVYILTLEYVQSYIPPNRLIHIE